MANKTKCVKDNTKNTKQDLLHHSLPTNAKEKQRREIMEKCLNQNQT